MQAYQDMLAKAAPDTDPRHILAGLDDLDPEQAAFCIAMAGACVKVFGADLVEGIARERGI